MACVPNELMAQGTCFLCLTPDMRQAVRLRLLCGIANEDPALNITPGGLLAASVCFLCLDRQQRDAVETYLLCQLVRHQPVTCNPTSLMAAAACFSCVQPEILKGIQIYLLCALVNGTEVASCDPAALAEAAACFICLQYGKSAMRAALYCALSQDETVTCTPQGIISTAGQYIGQPADLLDALELALVVASYQLLT